MNFPEKKPSMAGKILGPAGTVVGTAVGALAGNPAAGAAIGGAVGNAAGGIANKDGVGAAAAAANGVTGTSSAIKDDAMARRLDTQNKLAEAAQAVPAVIPDAYAQDAIKRRLAEAAFAVQGAG